MSMEPLGSQFTVSLPSDSSKDNYPNNKTSNYRTKLAVDVDLSHGEWEVGLLDIQYPTSWLNVMENEMTGTLSVNSTRPWIEFAVPKGSYPDSQTFLKTLDDVLKSTSQGHIYLKQNVNADIQGEYEDPVTIELNSSTTNATKTSRVILSKPLANVLGLFDSVKMCDDFRGRTARNPTEKNRAVTDVRHGLTRQHDIIVRRFVQFKNDIGEKEGTDIRRTMFSLPRKVDVLRGFHMIYVYSDIIEHAHLGDTMAPMLRVFIPHYDPQNTKQDHREFISPHYKILRTGTRVLSTIDLYMADEMGRMLVFEQSGKVTATLHFRKL